MLDGDYFNHPVISKVLFIKEAKTVLSTKSFNLCFPYRCSQSNVWKIKISCIVKCMTDVGVGRSAEQVLD